MAKIACDAPTPKVPGRQNDVRSRLHAALMLLLLVIRQSDIRLHVALTLLLLVIRQSNIRDKMRNRQSEGRGLAVIQAIVRRVPRDRLSGQIGQTVTWTKLQAIPRGHRIGQNGNRNIQRSRPVYSS